MRARLGSAWPDTGPANNRQLMQAILHDRIPIANIVNAQAIEEAPKGYADFDKGAPVKYILDPHGTVAKAA